ncbi:MAG: 6-hydroxymethylpterin diphosphokinase MptE-like protein, partial [bacterium]
IIEPDPAVARHAMEQRQLDALLGHPRVTLLLGPTVNEAFQHWLGHFSMLAAGGVSFVNSPNIDKRLPDRFADEFADQVRGYMHTMAGNLQTLMVMAHVYQANTLRSMKYLVKNPGVINLTGAFKDVPVLCLAAGPSLAKQLDRLAPVQDRALLIACDTTTRPLLNAGITPHLICAGDPQEANHRHIAGLADKIPSYLCAEPMTYPSSLREYQQRLFIASFRDRLMNWLEAHVGEIGQVLCWGSVATMVFDLGRRVGGNPVVFLGQDLSFPGGRTYVPGTYFETELGHVMTAEAQSARQRDPGLINATDIFGNPVQTNRQMFAYHRWFVREIALTEPGVDVINATEGGILREGVEIRTFDEVVEQYLTAPVNVWDRLASCYERPMSRDLPKLIEGLGGLNSELEEMASTAKTAFRDIGAFYRSMHSMQRLPETLAQERLQEAEAARRKIFTGGIGRSLMEMGNQTGIKSFLNANQALGGKSANLLVYQNALEAYLKLFASVVQAVGRIRQPAADALNLANAALTEGVA